MSYTSLKQLRSLFPVERPLAAESVDQVVPLRGTAFAPFYGAAVDAESVVVKRASRGLLQRQSLQITASGSVIGSGRLVRESVVVAVDSSLRQRYQEKIDYEVNYETGTIKRVSTGTLAEGVMVTIWFESHLLFTPGSDYILEADRGEVRRVSSGQIRDGESVLIDYRPVSLSVPDELLTQAVSIANQQIAQEIDPSGVFEADSTLGLAATYRAMSIACEGAASRELSRRDATSPVAQSWLALAERHERRSRELLGQFCPPVISPAAPQHT